MKSRAPAHPIGVLVLFILAGLLAIALLLLCSACRFHATLWLEIAGGNLELQVRYLLAAMRFRFRIHLCSAPYLTVEWLKPDGTVQPVFRAFEPQKAPSPWAQATWEAVCWREVSAFLEVGDVAAPALSVLAYGALCQLLQFVLYRYLSPCAHLSGVPNADGALFRLKVEGIATLMPAQIILKRLRKKRRMQHVTSN